MNLHRAGEYPGWHTPLLATENFERTPQANIFRRAAHHDLDGPRFCDEMYIFIVETQLIHREIKYNRTGLARLKLDALECLQLLTGRGTLANSSRT